MQPEKISPTSNLQPTSTKLKLPTSETQSYSNTTPTTATAAAAEAMSTSTGITGTNNQSAAGIATTAVTGQGTDFVKKLFQMLEENRFGNVVKWSDTGDSFLISDTNEFTKQVLPCYFKHSNFSSFVRQLNKYDFHKVKISQEIKQRYQLENVWEFKHPDFSRFNKSSLDNIKRKVPAKKDSGETVSAANCIPITLYRKLEDRVATLERENSALHKNVKHTTSQIQTLNQKYNSLVSSLLISKDINLSFSNSIQLLSKAVTQLGIQLPPMDLPQLEHLNNQHTVIDTHSNNQNPTPDTHPVNINNQHNQHTTTDLNATNNTGNNNNTNNNTNNSRTPDNKNGNNFHIDNISNNKTQRNDDNSGSITSAMHTNNSINNNPNTNSNLVGTNPNVSNTNANTHQEYNMPPLINEATSIANSMNLNATSQLGATRPDIKLEDQSDKSGIANIPSSSAVNPDTRIMNRPHGSALHVLLVEDDDVCIQLCRKFLMKYGCTVVVVTDGLSAISAVEQVKFDLVLMDIVMPNLDGASATSVIRSFDKDTPIIAMTGNYQRNDLMTYLNHGMTDILAKPFTKDDLYMILEKHKMDQRLNYANRSPEENVIEKNHQAQISDTNVKQHEGTVINKTPTATHGININQRGNTNPDAGEGGNMNGQELANVSVNPHGASASNSTTPNPPHHVEIQQSPQNQGPNQLPPHLLPQLSAHLAPQVPSQVPIQLPHQPQENPQLVLVCHNTETPLQQSQDVSANPNVPGVNHKRIHSLDQVAFNNTCTNHPETVPLLNQQSYIDRNPMSHNTGIGNIPNNNPSNVPNNNNPEDNNNNNANRNPSINHNPPVNNTIINDSNNSVSTNPISSPNRSTRPNGEAVYSHEQMPSTQLIQDDLLTPTILETAGLTPHLNSTIDLNQTSTNASPDALAGVDMDLLGVNDSEFGDMFKRRKMI